MSQKRESMTHRGQESERHADARHDQGPSFLKVAFLFFLGLADDAYHGHTRQNHKANPSMEAMMDSLFVFVIVGGRCCSGCLCLLCCCSRHSVL